MDSPPVPSPLVKSPIPRITSSLLFLLFFLLLFTSLNHEVCLCSSVHTHTHTWTHTQRERRGLTLDDSVKSTALEVEWLPTGRSQLSLSICVTPFQHNNSLEFAHSLLSSTQGQEVCRSFRHSVRKQLNNDSTCPSSSSVLLLL